MNGPEPDWDALSRFVAGESEPTEALAVEAWLAAHPADEVLVRGVKAHAAAADADAHVPVDVDAAFRQVRARLAADVAAPREGLSVVSGGAGRAVVGGRTTAPSSRPWGRIVLAVAATVVAALGIRQWQGGATAGGANRVLATQVGQRDSLMLADGTKVVLAPGSRLTVAADFDAGNRVVTLEGAAYFDVHHDDAHPFTVRAARAEIRDVGTAFTVKTDDAGDVTVAVTHGIVALRDASEAGPAGVELRAGDRGVVSAGAVAVTRGTVTDDETSWTRGRLAYRDAPLAEVRADLKRWYGIDMQIADSALSRLTVTMPAQPDSASVINTIVTLLGADMVQRGGSIILRSAARGTIP